MELKDAIKWVKEAHLPTVTENQTITAMQYIARDPKAVICHDNSAWVTYQDSPRLKLLLKFGADGLTTWALESDGASQDSARWVDSVTLASILFKQPDQGRS